jgi:hypothetical protein
MLTSYFNYQLKIFSIRTDIKYADIFLNKLFKMFEGGLKHSPYNHEEFIWSPHTYGGVPSNINMEHLTRGGVVPTLPPCPTPHHSAGAQVNGQGLFNQPSQPAALPYMVHGYTLLPVIVVHSARRRCRLKCDARI